MISVTFSFNPSQALDTILNTQFTIPLLLLRIRQFNTKFQVKTKKKVVPKSSPTNIKRDPQKGVPICLHMIQLFYNS